MFPLHLDAALAGCDQPYSREDEQDGEDFNETERVQAEVDGGCDRDYGLDVVVHAGDGGPQGLLSYDYQNIAEEGGEGHDVEDAAYIAPGQAGPVSGDQVVVGEGQKADEGVGKHPLHDGEYGVFAYKILEKDEVGGVAELSEEYQKVSADIGGASGRCRCCMASAEDEQQCAAGSEGDAADLLAGDGLLEEECCQNHCPQRHAGGYDGGIDRGGEAHSEDVEALIEHYCQEGGHEKSDHILRLDLLRFPEKGGGPEEHHCPEYPQVREYQRCDDTARHDYFRHRGHKSPDAVGCQHSAVAFPAEIFHYLTIKAAANVHFFPIR